MLKSLILSSLALNLGLLLGRLSGFAREAFIAATYGATPQADIVVLMLTVPDLLVSILMGGALGAMLVPEFTQYPKHARQLLYQSLLFFGLVFMGVSTILFLGTDILVKLLAPGFSELQSTRASIAVGWVIWLIPLTVLAGVTTAFLHAKNCFMVAALGTLIINSFIILGLILVKLEYGSLQLIAYFILLGGSIRLLSQLLQTRPTWNPIASLAPWRLNRTLLIRYSQAMLSGSLLLLFPVVVRALASYEGEGSVALFNYATRLVEFPLAIAITFLSAVFFPRLSHSFSNDRKLHLQLIKYGLQITLGLSLIAAITLISQSTSYAEIVYNHGHMQKSSVSLVTTLASIGLLALPLQGLATFLTATYNSRRDTRTPLLVNGTGLVLFLIFSKFGVFGQGLQALMWGIVYSYGLICVLLFSLLKIETLSWKHVFFDKEFLRGIIYAILLSVFTNHWIGSFYLAPWLTLSLACFTALFSLLIIISFNKIIRSKIKARLHKND